MKNCELLWVEAKQKLIDLVKQQNIPLEKIALSFSGGRDSTIMLKMIEEIGWKNKIRIVFFNTSMEFEATYKFVEKKRAEGWIIEETKPKKTMPQIYKEYGYPFHSKKSSDMIYRLQQHKFNFKEDTYKSFDELIVKYPKCKSALRWLTGHEMGRMTCPLWVKRALVFNDLKIANKCCEFLKKRPVEDFNKENGIIMNIIGVRKSESLNRDTVYKSCVWSDGKKWKYFPLLYFNDQDIKDIVEVKNIELSDAYTIYKQERTGCVGCPYSLNYKQELEVLKQYEPKKAKIVEYLYKDVYKLKDKKYEK